MIDELRRTGIARWGVVPWINEFVDYLANCPRYPGHVRARPREGIFCNAMSDVIAAPYFLPFAKKFTSVASDYFGEPAHLWSLNAFYTDERTPYVGSINGLHRDREADKILTLFMFGTDVDKDGAQILAPNWFGPGPIPQQWDAVWGRAGTAWLADTRNLHCGLLPQKPRCLVWARWANVVPLAKHSEQLPDIP